MNNGARTYDEGYLGVASSTSVDLDTQFDDNSQMLDSCGEPIHGELSRCFCPSTNGSRLFRIIKDMMGKVVIREIYI